MVLPVIVNLRYITQAGDVAIGTLIDNDRMRPGDRKRLRVDERRADGRNANRGDLGAIGIDQIDVNPRDPRSLSS